MSASAAGIKAGLLRPALSLAYLRLALLFVFWISERLVDRAHHHALVFELALLAATVYAALALLASRNARDRPPGGWMPYAVLDLAFTAVLVYASGGAFSQLRYGLSILPIVAVFLGRPRHTTTAILAALAAYAVVEIARRAFGNFTDTEQTVAQALNLAWQGALAVVLSVLLTRKGDRIERLAEERGRLVTQALAAEEREQRRLAYALHDETVQSLLAVQLELPRVARGDQASFEHAQLSLRQVIAELREAIFELHPYTLEHAGLTATLEQIAEQQAARGNMRVAVAVDETAEAIHDRLMFTLAREFLTNAAKHAHANNVELCLTRGEDHLTLTVKDDGRGLDPNRRRSATREGHIGLASSAERVEGLGGTFTVSSAPGAGTVVRARVPVPRREPIHQAEGVNRPSPAVPPHEDQQGLSVSAAPLGRG